MPPTEASPSVIISSTSGCAAARASAVIGRIPSQPISPATSMPPIASMRESAPESRPKM